MTRYPMTWLVALCVALGLVAPAPAQAVSIGLVPTAQVVDVGGLAEVAIRITDLGDGTAPSLGVFDLDLSFDPLVLGLASVTYGDPVLGDQLDLFGLGSLTSTTPGSGTVNLFQLSLDLATDLDALQASEFTLVTLGFLTLAGGTSPLGLIANALGDADGNPVVATLTGGSITARPTRAVPEPGTLVFLVTGAVALVGTLLGGCRRRISSSVNDAGVISSPW